MKRIMFLVILGVAGAFLVRTYLVEGVSIATPSMEPTLSVGSEFYANNLTLLLRKPKRGEIIVFETPQEPDKGLVKRVIALPGESIAMDRKKVIINGEPLEEPYVQYVKGGQVFDGDHFPPMTVPEGHIFVLGDNRDVSNDSRDWRDPKNGKWSPFVPLSGVRGVITP